MFVNKKYGVRAFVVAITLRESSNFVGKGVGLYGDSFRAFLHEVLVGENFAGEFIDNMIGDDRLENHWHH